MDFKEAHAKLQEVAGGAYNSISYEVTTYRGGKREQQCGVYVDQKGWHTKGDV